MYSVLNQSQKKVIAKVTNKNFGDTSRKSPLLDLVFTTAERLIIKWTISNGSGITDDSGIIFIVISKQNEVQANKAIVP